MSASVEDVLRAARGAYRDQLEGRFWSELGEWSRRSGIEMMGTDAIEAHFLTNIVDETLKDPKVIKGIYARLAEYAADRETP